MLDVFAFAIATLSPTDTRAIPAFMQAGQLETLCASQTGAELCAGYILGSVDQILAEQDVWGRRRSVLCLPADVTVEQLKTAVQDHFRKRPEHSTMAAATVIAAALRASYACSLRRDGR